MKNNNYKIEYHRIYFENKWKNRFRQDSGLIFGIMKWWAGPCDYCYKFSVFGFELSIWFKRIFNEL